MPHSAEGLAFLTRLNALPSGPGTNFDDVLRPFLNNEQELRKLFAQDKANPRLENPYTGLVDVFGPDTEVLRKTRAREVDYNDEESLSKQYIMPLNETLRRKDGQASMVIDIDEFKKNWAIFTEGSLSQLFDWNNVIAAGGSVLSALLPLTDENKKSKRAIRKYYHSTAYPSSDVDLFLWGLTPEQAEKKIVTIYEAVRDSVPWDVTCIRTNHTVSIHSQYPYRSVQIVLRLYQSPAEILAGFDIDAPCCAYNGERVWANPRALIAMIRQCNTIDVTRRSPSYEVRLAKYAKRGFEVYVPGLEREKIDPTIYERSIAKIEGLARLLVLEKLHNPDDRQRFLESRRDLRGRPFPLRRPGSKKKRRYKGDLKSEIGGLEMNDYDVASLHIPYGPGWNAGRIEKLIYQTDLGMNSTFNPKNKGRRIHRHPAFFGTVEECMEDCCEHCAEPIDEDERNLQKEEDKLYIRGRISFIEENPGRQTLSGSFNPIDEGEWAEQVYIRPIEQLFEAIAAQDITLVRSILEENKVSKTIDLQNRDHVGRTTLHLAILVKNEEIAKLLIDEGCKMISRVVDGRTALHMAAQYGMDSLIEMMFEKSKANKEEAERKEKESGKIIADKSQETKNDTSPPPNTTAEIERPSSEDDWSSDDNDGKLDDSHDIADDEGDDFDHGDEQATGHDDGTKTAKKNEKEEVQLEGEVPEDGDEPDVIDVNTGDWDQGFTPLCYAILYSTRSTVDILLRHKADPNQAAIPSGTTTWDSMKNILPLFLTLIRSEADEDIAVSIAERLIEAGASVSTADDKLMTILHYAVFAQKVKLLDMFLRKDPGAKAALDFPVVNYNSFTFPIVSAITKGAYATVATLLAHGAKINPTGADVTRAKAISNTTDSHVWSWYNVQDYSKMIYSPVETAIANEDRIIDILLEVGADVNLGTTQARSRYANAEDKKTIMEWVVNALEFDLPKKIGGLKKECKQLEEKIQQKTYTPPTENLKTWKEYLDNFTALYKFTSNKTNMENNEKQKKDKLTSLNRLDKLKEYLEQVHKTLDSIGVKTWEEIYGNSDEDQPNQGRILVTRTVSGEPKSQPKLRYTLLTKTYRQEWVQLDQTEHYDELFEAAYKGDDTKIEKLCVPSTEESDASVVPVQITVEAMITDDPNMRTGLTPLYAAISGRRWNTAKLIMGIAAAQYSDKDDEEKNELQAALFDLVDEEEADGSDCNSCYSDDTIDGRKRQTKFIDIAKKISVHTKVHPSALLNSSLGWVLNGEVLYTNILDKVIGENNFDAFVHLFNIQDSMKAKVSNHTPYISILGYILQGDNPIFLDELIRRTGVGIDIATLRQTGEGHLNVLNDQNRLYLGLNIHGKKRKDLARKGDPNALGGDQEHQPLVWQAIRTGSTSIIEYLASKKPLDAYKYFATNGEGDKAEWLRHSKNLEGSLREWLGWTVNSIGESPLTMAISANRKELLPDLFAKEVKLMKSALDTKIKFVGFNPILFAASKGCDKEIFQFLLKKGVSTTQLDSVDDWNIYHWICKIGRPDLLEFLFENIPQRVSKALLGDRTKEKLNTPLHIAIKEGCITIVETILNFTTDGLLTYDARGCTPLHLAIMNGHAETVELILKFLPPEGLYLENGVGKTPYEDAEKRAMKPLTEIIRLRDPPSLGRDVTTISAHSDVDAMEKELQSVAVALKLLFSNGVLQKGSTLSNAFEKFISSSEGRLEKLKTEATIAKAEVEDRPKWSTDSTGAIKTFEVIKKAVGPNTAKRTLIRLSKVQKSVKVDLNGVGNRNLKPSTGDGFGDEETEVSEEKGIIRRYITAVKSDEW